MSPQREWIRNATGEKLVSPIVSPNRGEKNLNL